MKIRKNYPFKKLTTLKIGGLAKMFTEAKTEKQLIDSIYYAKKNNLDCLVIGDGSNLLVSDQGYNGLLKIPRAESPWVFYLGFML